MKLTRQPTISQALNVVLITALLLSTLCSKPTIIVNKGITQDELNNALEKQKEQMIQEVELKIERNAFKSIKNIDSLMSVKHLRDSLRSIALGR